MCSSTVRGERSFCFFYCEEEEVHTDTQGALPQRGQLLFRAARRVSEEKVTKDPTRNEGKEKEKYK